MDDRTLKPPGEAVEGAFFEAFQRTLERTPVGLALLDPPATIRYTNPALQSLIPGVEGAQSLDELLAPWAGRRLREEAMPGACEGGHWHGEVGLAEGDPEPLRLHLIAACTPQGPEDTPWIAMFHRPSESAAATPSASSRPWRLPVPMQDETHLLDPTEIHLLEADRHYTHIYTSHDTLLASQPLANFQRQLADQPFLRTHRSFLVNLHSVRSLRRDGSHCYLRLDGLPERTVPVSRRRLGRVEEMLGLREIAEPV